MLAIGLLKVSLGQGNKIDLIPEHLTVLEYFSAVHIVFLSKQEIKNSLRKMNEERRVVVLKLMAGLLGSHLELVKDFIHMMNEGQFNSRAKMQDIYSIILARNK